MAATMEVTPLPYEYPLPLNSILDPLLDNVGFHDKKKYVFIPVACLEMFSINKMYQFFILIAG